MDKAVASAKPQNPKFAYAVWFIVLAVLLATLTKVLLLSADKGPGDATAPTAQPAVSETKSKLRSPERVASETVSVPPPQVELSGVVGEADGQYLAIISVNKSPESMVRVGNLIFGVSTVTEINQDSLTYSYGSDFIRVALQNRKATPQAKASAERPPINELQDAAMQNTFPGFVANTSIARQQSSVDSKNGNVEFRQAVEQKMKSLQQRP